MPIEVVVPRSTYSTTTSVFDEASKFEVIEEKVEPVVLALNFKTSIRILTSDERESNAKLYEEFLNVFDQAVLDLSFELSRASWVRVRKSRSTLRPERKAQCCWVWKSTSPSTALSLDQRQNFVSRAAHCDGARELAIGLLIKKHVQDH